MDELIGSEASAIVMTAALSTAPVRVKTGAGEPLPVPWEAPENIA